MISLIIPAFNEEKTIGNVVKIAKQSNFLNEIIVVNDASTDNTLDEIKKTNVEYINLKENVGKGGALTAGIKKSKGDIILFLDADLIGLTTKHIEQLLAPVINKKADMTIGIFSENFIHQSMPSLSGQRALTRKFLLKIADFSKARFGVEMIITQSAKQQKIKIQKVMLKELNHIPKSKKYQSGKGYIAEIKTWNQIINYRTYAKISI